MEQQAREDYWAALGAADRHRALSAVKRLHALGVPAQELVEGLVVPAQDRIGELWLAGEWSVAQEHAATAINEGLVHWLSSFATAPAEDRPLVLVACVEGERHALPALIVAEGLTQAGLRVHYVGGDPEPSDLLQQILLLKPHAVCFSASLSSTLATAKGLFASVRAIGIPVVVGGRAFGGDAGRAFALGATAYADGAAEAARLILELPRRSSAPEVGEARPAEDEAAWIVAHSDEIVPFVARSMAAQSGRSELPTWHGDLAEHVRHLLGSLAAALVADDDAILREARDWLGLVLSARGADAGVLADLWATVGRPLRGHPLARVFLARTAPRVPGAQRADVVDDVSA